MLAMPAAAVAVKVVVVAPAATVTEAGTVSSVVLLASITLDPPGGETWVMVTVQVLTALCPTLAGLHATPETSAGASRLMAAVCELPLKVAVTVAEQLLDRTRPGLFLTAAVEDCDLVTAGQSVADLVRSDESSSAQN